MGRKVRHMEEKYLTASQLNQEKLQNEEAIDNTNPSILQDKNSKDFDKNIALNQNNMHLEHTSKAGKPQSDQQPNQQKDTRISSNSTISGLKYLL